MPRISGIASVCFATLMGGCAIHPLPENVAKVPTRVIVRMVRCEARGALKQNLIVWLRKAQVNNIADQIENGAIALDKVDHRLFRGDVQKIVQRFENSAIGYDFAFDITETNNLDATLDLMKNFHHMFGSANIHAGVDRSRENRRTFTITDKFIDLFHKLGDSDCSENEVGENFMYPISGRIGLDEMIDDFVRLSLFDDLGNPKSSAAPTVVEDIKFTTTLSSTVAPKINVSPLGNAFQVVDATLSAVNSRSDVHEVTVSMALPVAKAPTAAPAEPATKTGSLVNTREDVSEAEKAAAHAIEQYILRYEVGRPVIIAVPQ